MTLAAIVPVVRIEVPCTTPPLGPSLGRAGVLNDGLALVAGF